MATDDNGVLDQEQKLDELVTAYLQEQAGGSPPDRRKWLDRYPELAGELAQFFADQDQLNWLVQPLREAVVAGHAPPLPEDAGTESPSVGPGRLGDYEIIREVGRGGMGVVYEARQVSLRRQVALKVLPFAATLDPRRLQRFQNEAQAAAGLHHTNIVPVYAVGCERGVYYYAMQFIDGQNLAALIQEQRTASRGPSGPGVEDATGPYTPASIQPDLAEPDAAPLAVPSPAAETKVIPVAAQSTDHSSHDPTYYRRVAELGIQAAEALEHAHQLGVVHRDIEPANLLLDRRGTLWITDFGLAQMQTDASLTQTGDLVGTLRYMSPEQALAKRVIIDHRTDIYSLGVTLYELLTLQPVFTGGDRQEVLRQIAFEEPRPPRRIDRAIPHELETIVLKAMEKNPADRYATAQELAEDIERHLKDEPIKARRPTLVQRARRWGRRHRAGVAAALVCLTVCGAALAGSVGFLVRDQMVRRAETERVVAEALREADVLHAGGKWPEALAAARRAKGLLAGGPAGKALSQKVHQFRTDLEMIGKLEDIRLRMANRETADGNFDTAEKDPAYEEAFGEYGLSLATMLNPEVVDQLRARAIRVELAAALDDWARARQRSRKGEDQLRQQLVALARAIDPDEWRIGLRKALEERDLKALKELAASDRISTLPATTQSLLGVALRVLGAEREAIALLRQAQRQHPADFSINHELAFCFDHLKPPQWDEALRFYTVAQALRSQSPIACSNLGAALTATGALEEAIAFYKEALRLKPDYAQAHNNLGYTHQKKGALPEAIASHQEAIRLKPDYAEAHHDLGVALARKGALAEAIASYQEAIRLKPDFAQAHANLSSVLREKGALPEAIAACQEAIRLKPDHHEAHNNLGIALADKRDRDGAIAAFKKAIRHKPDFYHAHYNLGMVLNDKGDLGGAIEAFKKTLLLKPDYPEAYCNLGKALDDKGDLGGAIAAYREAIRLKPGHPTPYNNLGASLAAKGDLSGAIVAYQNAIRLKPNVLYHCNLASALERTGQLDKAIAQLKEAIRLKPDYADAHVGLGDFLKKKGDLAGAIAAFKEAIRLKPDNAEAHTYLAQCVRLVELDAKLSAVLRGDAKLADNATTAERFELAQFCQLNKLLYTAAARFYAEAFAADPKLADGNRYNAACAAALAGCGKGKDAAGLDDKERARLRKQALAWLRDELEALRRLLAKEQARPAVAQQTQHWLKDPDFAGVRGPSALKQLPDSERADWEKLWQEVEALLKQAATPAKPAAPPK